MLVIAKQAVKLAGNAKLRDRKGTNKKPHLKEKEKSIGHEHKSKAFSVVIKRLYRVAGIFVYYKWFAIIIITLNNFKPALIDNTKMFGKVLIFRHSFPVQVLISNINSVSKSIYFQMTYPVTLSINYCQSSK